MLGPFSRRGSQQLLKSLSVENGDFWVEKATTTCISRKFFNNAQKDEAEVPTFSHDNHENKQTHTEELFSDFCTERATATCISRKFLNNAQKDKAKAAMFRHDSYENQQTDTDELFSDFCVERATTTCISRNIHNNAQKDKAEALILSRENHENSLTTIDDLFALTRLLNACTKRKDLQTGTKLHAEIAARGLFQKDIFIGGTIVNMYAKCGDIKKAQEVFNDLPGQNVVSWTALITGYIQMGQVEEGLYYFERMQREGFYPDAVTFASILKACGSIGAVDKGFEIHNQIVKNGLLKRDIVVGTALVDMYVKCGLLRKAQEVFDELPLRNLVSWNVLIIGYAQWGHVEEALNYFERMQGEGFSPDRITFAGILKAFGNMRAVVKGQKLHALIIQNGILEKDIVIGNALVDMYSKCGALEKALSLFDELPFRNVVSWTTLIVGYAQHGQGEKSLDVFERMQHEGFSPDQVTFACILKACGSTGAAATGQEIHVQLVREGLLGKDIIVGTALVEMYANCGALGKAREAFVELSIRNVVLWNTLIGGYAQHGHCEEAIECFQQMQSEGVFPDAATFGCMLKACGSIGAASKGLKLHAQIVVVGFIRNNAIIVNALVDMYAKCNLLKKAQLVVDCHGAQDLAIWNVMIVGYIHHSRVEEALSCFKQMHQEGVFADTTTLTCIIKACGDMGILRKGQELHVQIIIDGWLDKDIIAASALIDMYAKCSALLNAQEVFDNLFVRTVGLWNGLIAGYVQHGYVEEALCSYKRMLCEGLLPDNVTLSCIFNACGSIGLPNKGLEIHAQIGGDILLRKDMILLTSLLDMYAKCGLFEKAKDIFDRLLVWDIVSWNALLAGYVKHEQVEEALKCFEQMQWQGFCPNAVTFLCILKACGSARAVFMGQEIHAEIVRLGLLKTDVVVGNALVDMYANCDLIGKAQEVLKELPVRSVISWNVLISGCIQHYLNEEALICSECMQHEGHYPDRVTFLSMLKAVSSLGSSFTYSGQKIHSDIVKVGLLETDLVVGTALVDMYAKCGKLDEAREVFNKLQNRDVVLWNVVINGYVQLMHDEEALKHFKWMQLGGLSPDSVTIVCILRACSSVGAANKGQELHDVIVREGLLEIDMVVGNAVVDMYANCGMLEEAQNVFNNLSTQDVVSWNSVISGYAQIGKLQTVFNFVDKMIQEDNLPDLITFTLVLNTCSHSGLLEEGQMYFETMFTNYSVMPDVEHYSCMVDLFGRAGQIEKAVGVIKWMPLSDSPTMWHALLGACRKWDNIELGDWAFEHAIQLDELDAGAYICLSNIYVGSCK